MILIHRKQKKIMISEDGMDYFLVDTDQFYTYIYKFISIFLIAYVCVYF